MADVDETLDRIKQITQETIDDALESGRMVHPNDLEKAQRLAYQIICNATFIKSSGSYIDGFLADVASQLNQTPVKFNELAQKNKEGWFDAVWTIRAMR